MNATYSNFFDTVALNAIIPDQITPRFITPVVTKATVKPGASPVPAMSASLWRHSLGECEAARRHGLVTRSLCGLLGVLSLGSMAAAAWQMHALLSGNHLHDAITAFLR